LFKQQIKLHEISALKAIVLSRGFCSHQMKSQKKAAQQLQLNGFDVRAILSPTVAPGKERLRICLHTYNSDQEIISLIDQLKKIQNG
jgi:8-amino-7-oxononanoate synthase